MATTLSSSSSVLRQQIGQAAARLRRALASLPSSTPPSADPIADTIQKDYNELDALHNLIDAPFSRLQRLHSSWMVLIQQYLAEAEVYDPYIRNHGDYTALITDAISAMESLDKRLHELETSATQLNVTLHKSSSLSEDGTVRYHRKMYFETVRRSRRCFLR